MMTPTTSTAPAIMSGPRESGDLEGAACEGGAAGIFAAGSTGRAGFKESRMPARVERRAGSRRRHSRTMPKKGGGMDAGTAGSLPLPSASRGRWVRTSPSTTPSDQTSDAGEIFPSAISGASYLLFDREGVAGSSAE